MNEEHKDFESYEAEEEYRQSREDKRLEYQLDAMIEAYIDEDD